MEAKEKHQREMKEAEEKHHSDMKKVLSIKTGLPSLSGRENSTNALVNSAPGSPGHVQTPRTGTFAAQQQVNRGNQGPDTDMRGILQLGAEALHTTPTMIARSWKKPQGRAFGDFLLDSSDFSALNKSSEVKICSKKGRD